MIPSFFRFDSAGRAAPAALAVALLLAMALPAAAQTEAPRPVQDLARCIEIALAASPSVAIASEQTGVAAAEKRRALGAFLPSLSLGRQWSKSERTDFDVIDVLTDQKTDLDTKSAYESYSADSRLDLFSGFGKFGSLKAAKRELAAAQADESYSRQLVIQNVAGAYFELLRNERLLTVAEGSRDVAQRELEKSETYYRLGSVAKSDVLQAKVRLQQTMLDVVRARNSVEQSFADLAHAMNVPLAERFDIDSSLLERDYPMPDLGSLYDEALANRADVMSGSLRVEARRGDVTSANSGLLPSLTLFASYTRYKNESPYRFGAQESDNLQYGYSVDWAIFDRMQTLSGRSQAKARERIAEYDLTQKKLDVQLEVRRLYNSLAEARERISLSRETIEQAREELRLAQERFKVGAGTTLDRINAEVNLAQAQADEVQGICDYLTYSVQLDRAAGRDLDRLWR